MSDPNILKEVLSRSGSARFLYINSLAKKASKCIYNNGCNCIQPSNYTKDIGDKSKEKAMLIKIFADFKNRELFKDQNTKKETYYYTRALYSDFQKNQERGM